MTDGEPVFKKVKDENPSTLFLRQRPTLEKSAEIPMDEADGKRMIQGFLSFKSASIILKHAEWDLNKIEKTFNRTFTR